MAAVTIEDCLKIVPNRFELALIASYRAEQLANGAPILYTPKKMEKNTVVALREIAAGLLDVEQIREEIRDKMKSKSLFANFKNESVDEVLKDENLDDLSDINLDDDDDDLEDINSEDEDEYYDDLGSEEIEDDEK